MRQIRGRIISGKYPLGSQIPSTTELVAETGRSRPVVRQAIAQLQAEGILEGHQGKGVFVAAMPVDADHRRADTEALGEEFAELRQEFRELAERAQKDDDLRARVNRIETILVNLHRRLNFPNPLGGERDITEKAAGRGRAAR
jgi:DNA-binding GntR family transcriptional regulator